ncbi:hypothetical protein GWI33_001806 [Rhynchophorus ferrugineus]|uniref:Reverse transcriptase n=1 Tax=Rhynchophorus ferrugineus TaxID=354439 RepID=A0A834IN68_RHYFE|nr:hypothetical protein GWI33_001806 [Rhynchophorus ferrugineus]
MFYGLDDDYCRLCKSLDGSIFHIICQCPRFAQTEYRRRHDRIARNLHWALCKKYGFLVAKRPSEHFGARTIANGKVRLLWDSQLDIVGRTSANKPDISIFEDNSITLIDVTIPGDPKVLQKEQEKIEKYREISEELADYWHRPVKFIPITIGALGTVTPNYDRYFNELDDFSSIHNRICMELRYQMS